MSADDGIQIPAEALGWMRIGEFASDLLQALQPWEFQPQAVRSAAVRLTCALAAQPLPEFDSVPPSGETMPPETSSAHDR